MAKVAWIGLGVMGYPMAGHIRKKGGHDLVVYNRNGAKAEAWAKEYGGKTAATPADAAKDADFVFCCVGNDNDLREVTLGAKGAFNTVKKGAVFIDNTTASANVARELYAAAKAKGFDFLDAPVSGGQAGAVNGALTVMIGGDQAAFDKAKPVIDNYARMATLIGPAGAGQLTKMVNQICVAVTVQGVSRGDRVRAEGRPRRPQGDGDDRQGRGPVLADGQPLEDHERGQVRLRLRGRLDAQGPRHHHGGGQAQRCQGRRRRPGRRLLRRGAEDGRQPLGHLQPDRAVE